MIVSSLTTTDFGYHFRLLKAFYSLLDGNSSSRQVSTNKENIVLHHSEFSGDQMERNTYTSGPRNPYFQQTNPSTSFSSNPYGRFSPVPQFTIKPRPNSTSSTPPTLTQDQLARIEENRKRALAIRMKKQNSPFY
jgi:hypothetical protein